MSHKNIINRKIYHLSRLILFVLAPVMEQLSDEITDVEFYNIDVDENPDLAREYRIMNIHAVIAIKGGQVAGQQIGLVSKDDKKGFIDGVF